MTFRDRVYKIVSKIPKGNVATYGQIARLSGSAKAGRAVGMCMKTNPNAPRVPCHRVVASDGSLTGYSGGKGIVTKKEMLLKEGVHFKSLPARLDSAKRASRQGDKVDMQVSLWKA